MSSGAPPPPAGATRTDRIRSSSDLGATLRSVLLTPERGYRGAMRTALRRERAARKPIEGIAPSVLAAIGGAGAMLLWLKVSAAFGVRKVSAAQFRWNYLVAAIVLGALLGLLSQRLWAACGVVLSRALGAEAKAPDLRLAWGGSAVPQAFALVLLLPLDLSIAGGASFTDARFADRVAAAWASLSLALAIALALWSLYLFFRGTRVATGLGVTRALLVMVVAGVCVAAVCAVSVVIALQLAG